MMTEGRPDQPRRDQPGTQSTPAQEPSAPVVPQEVSVAANSIGYALAEFCHLDLHVDAVTAAAQRLYDQGLLARYRREAVVAAQPTDDPCRTCGCTGHSCFADCDCCPEHARETP
jgi:hypothetical protein